MHLPAAIGIVVALIGSFLAFKTFYPPQPTIVPTSITINQSDSATPSASVNASASFKTLKASSSPTVSSKATSSSAPQTTANNNSNSTSNTSSNTSSNTTQTTSSSPSSTPGPTPPSYTYSGNNLSVKVSCLHGENTFDISFNGSATTQSSDDGVWGVITGGSPSPLYFLYQSGNYPNSVSIGGGYNDSVSSIRGQNSLTLSSAPGSFYEMKLYSAPSTSGTPSLDKQIGNAQFAADCQW